MKGLVILMAVSMMLIGCGQMQTNADSAANVIAGMNDNGSLDDGSPTLNDESLLDSNVELTETGDNSIMLKFAGAELLIDFLQDFTGQEEDTAMVINGVEVAANLFQDSQSFQALLASLITAQLEDVNILGISAPQLVQVGLQLINGDATTADMSNIFGALVRGALSMFASKTPFGSIFEQILAPIVDQDNSSNDIETQPQPVEGSGIKDTIINTIGGLLAGSNPLLGSIFGIISQLIK